MMKSLKETGVFKLPLEFKQRLEDFLVYSIDKQKTVELIDECYKQYNYLIDPHTAVAYGAYINLNNNLKGKTVVVSTASPYKFIETVNDVFKVSKQGLELAKDIKEITNVSYPKLLEDIYNNEISKTVWTKENMEQNLIKMIGEIDESC